jgi:hypothetical protein
MGDIAVRRPATLLFVLLAAVLLLLSATSVDRATLAAATSGHDGPVPSVINAGTTTHLTITVKSAPTEIRPDDKHDSGDGGDD